MIVPIPEFTKDAPCSNIHELGEEEKTSLPVERRAISSPISISIRR
jgi:hypothetical protein